MATKVAVLQLKGLKLAVGLVALTVFDFHKMDVSLIWRSCLGSWALNVHIHSSTHVGGVAVAGAGSSLFPPRPPAFSIHNKDLTLALLSEGQLTEHQAGWISAYLY